MNILVLNSGSSSIKYQLFNMTSRAVLSKGVVERIGIKDSFLKHQKFDGIQTEILQDIPDHQQGIQLVIDTLTDYEHGVLSSTDEIAAIGHRVVHGGEKFKKSTLINEAVVEQIEIVSDLAPLHNPHNLTGIRICAELMPNKPQVAVFDTVFHQTMEPEAYMYGLPYRYYQDYGIRKYGFHGTSHQYVTNRAAEFLGKPLENLRLISCHLGNGASIAAVKHGKSIDTTMGLTPLEGLIMGTRCGDIDPAIVPYIIGKEDLSLTAVDQLMNKESGLLGISGISNDLRDIEKGAEQGNKRAQLALRMYTYRIIKYIGSYLMALGGADALIFTAGVGENQQTIRQMVCDGLKWLNVHIDAASNRVRGEEQEITTADSSIKVLVIPTNEELLIAEDTANIVAEQHN